jgi:hypothetical protein
MTTGNMNSCEFVALGMNVSILRLELPVLLEIEFEELGLGNGELDAGMAEDEFGEEIFPEEEGRGGRVVELGALTLPFEGTSRIMRFMFILGESFLKVTLTMIEPAAGILWKSQYSETSSTSLDLMMKLSVIKKSR